MKEQGTKMRKFITALLVGLLLIVLAACGRSTTTAVENGNPPKSLSKEERQAVFIFTLELKEKTDDNSLAYRGAAKRFEITTGEVKDIVVEGSAEDWPTPELERKRAEIIADYLDFSHDQTETKEFMNRVNASSMEQLEAYQESLDEMNGWFGFLDMAPTLDEKDVNEE